MDISVKGTVFLSGKNTTLGIMLNWKFSQLLVDYFVPQVNVLNKRQMQILLL